MLNAQISIGDFVRDVGDAYAGACSGETLSKIESDVEGVERG
jgi:hypothetical protein